MTSSISGKFLASATILSVLALTLDAQVNKVIDVNEPRPLWRALDQLEIANPGIAINYEDPPYESPAEVQDSATPQQQTAHPGFHLIVPKSGHVTAEIISSSTGSIADTISNLNLLLASYRQTALSGNFRIEQANGMLYVTPTTVLAASGASLDVVSPMATLISLPGARRSVPATAQAIFDAVSKATGLRFGFATFPFPPSNEVTFGATNEPARDALARLFALMGKVPVSYRLLFEPKPDLNRAFDYMVNVHLAGYLPPQAQPGPAGVGPIAPTVIAPQSTRGQVGTAPFQR